MQHGYGCYSQEQFHADAGVPGLRVPGLYAMGYLKAAETW